MLSSPARPALFWSRLHRLLTRVLASQMALFSVDHLHVYFSIDTQKPRHIRKELAFRKFRSIWVPGFIIHKAPSGPLTNVDQPLSDLVEAYHTAIEARFSVYNDDNT